MMWLVNVLMLLPKHVNFINPLLSKAGLNEHKSTTENHKQPWHQQHVVCGLHSNTR